MAIGCVKLSFPPFVFLREDPDSSGATEESRILVRTRSFAEYTLNEVNVLRMTKKVLGMTNNGSG